ncbi:MAG: integrase arm-type DNA-binding domain-containing protein [Methylocystis sp.]
MKKTAKDPAKITKPGRHGLGAGLWLTVAKTGGKSWSYRFTFNGRARTMGLGGWPRVSLEQARTKAAEARFLARQGTDPIAQRRHIAAGRDSRSMTFAKVAEGLISDLRHGWKCPKSETQWRASLAAYVYPHIGDKDVAAISKSDIVRCLKPIWLSKSETAKRVRARIEQILSRATALDLRQGDNPAALGLMQHLLPRSNRTRTVNHHAALPYADMPKFMRQLGGLDDIAARALEFTILTAARSAEVLGARWEEIDTKARLWSLPASRMKAGVEHAVTLSNAALALLMSLPRDHEFVFAGVNGRRLQADSMRQILRRLEREGLTVHGFRSSFRDWCAEETRHERDVCEKALAHAVDSKVEASYRRGKLLEKRAELMSDWANFCGDAGKVVPLRASLAR